MPPLHLIVCAASGGALGAACRFGLSWFLQNSPRLQGLNPYLATSLINVVGCLGIGWLLGGDVLTSLQSALNLQHADTLRVLLAMGFLGGFTTFSAFGYEALSLLQDVGPGRALFYTFAQVGLGFGAVVIGAKLAS